MRWLLTAWLRSLFPFAFRRAPSRKPRRRPRRLTLVGLEDRLAPAVTFHATRLSLPSDGGHARPTATAVADFNGDGLADLAVANGADNTVAVRLNVTPRGSTAPSFGAQAAYVTGRGPSALAVGDFNGDGRPDLAVTNRRDGTVSVLLNQTAPGNTIGVFGPATAFATGRGPSAVAVGDVNGDGRPDLVVANEVGNTVSVLLNRTPVGNTVGGFGAPMAFATGRSPSAVAVGDFNGDGAPDLAVANRGSNSVSLLLNRMPLTGTTVGGFGPQTAFATGRAPSALAVGDFNGDGRPDLAVANQKGNSVSVLLNHLPVGNTVGGFGAPTAFATGRGPSAVAVGDFDGDGRPDLVVTNRGGRSVSLLLNETPRGNTVGGFGAQTAYATGRGPSSVAVGDLNGDGRLDLAAGNRRSGDLTLLVQQAPPAGPGA